MKYICVQMVTEIAILYSRSIKAKELLKGRFSSLGFTTISNGGREKRVTNLQEIQPKQIIFHRTKV